MRRAKPQRMDQVERQAAQGAVVDVGLPPRCRLCEERTVALTQRGVVLGPSSEQERGAGAIGAHPAKVETHARLDAVLGARVGAKLCQEAVLELPGQLDIERGRERGLVREVVVERANADPCLTANVLERRA